MSPSLKRLMKVFNWTDSFRHVFPNTQSFSRYYDNDRFGEGATRIDRIYHFGDMAVKEAQYVGVAFSDHMGHIVKFSIPGNFGKLISPKSRPLFKANPDIVRDPVFKTRLQENITQISEVRVNLNLDILSWWEDFVKPRIKSLLIERRKEVARERRGILNLLLISQAYLVRKIQRGNFEKLSELKYVQLEIQNWYIKESEKIKLQGKVDEIDEAENVRIYHHEIHQKKIKKSAILKLQIDENTFIEGHPACAAHLEDSVAKLLQVPAVLDEAAQDLLLAEVQPVFTPADNILLCKATTKKEVEETLSEANLHAAPGSDGITSFVYKECWDLLGDSLTEVVQAVRDEEKQPTRSQRTSLMGFGTKPKKAKSLKPSDKRKISLLNADFKVITGCDAKRFKKVATHTLSPCQLAAGDDRRIYHGINKARDAVVAASGSKEGMGILDNDYKAAFDFMVMLWVFKVLLVKGVDPAVISRLKNIYKNNITIVVVNNMLGKSFVNNRWSMRQGDLPSVYWFAYGIDPLVSYLDERLQGITIYKTPTLGPTLPRAAPLPSLEEKYKLIAYVDDVKPAITSMNEFLLVDKASLLFENASGCELHRDPSSGKVKFLPLGRWRGTLQQEDIPLPYILLSQHLDMVGVVLKSTFTQTRKTNCDELLEKFGNLLGAWKGGKFMPLTQRPWSINTYALPKIWFRCHSLELRSGDVTKLNSLIKSWLYADMLEKPEELAMHRPRVHGGLGVHHIKSKALAILIRSFLETAISPKFIRNQYQHALFRWHVLGDTSMKDPGTTPYYSAELFSEIKNVVQGGVLNVANMSTKQWYWVLLEKNVTMREDNPGLQPSLIPVKCENNFPMVEWDRTWQFAQLKGLNSEQTSFLFKVLHNILPTSSRLFRLNQKASPLCTLCSAGSIEDCMHALLRCSYNNTVNNFILEISQKALPQCKLEDIITLNLNLDKPKMFPLVWLLSHLFYMVWKLRTNKKTVNLFNIRAELETKINILRKSRHSSCIDDLELLINL